MSGAALAATCLTLRDRHFNGVPDFKSFAGRAADTSDSAASESLLNLNLNRNAAGSSLSNEAALLIDQKDVNSYGAEVLDFLE